MKKNRFSPEQVARVLKEFEGGKSVPELLKELASARQYFTNGVSAIEAWKPLILNV